MKNFDVLKFHYLLISISFLVQCSTVIGTFYSISNPPNKCITPSGAKGHCEDITHCRDPDLIANEHKLFEHRCIIERRVVLDIPLFPIEFTKKHVGVCCQDDIVQKPSSKGKVQSKRHESKKIGRPVANELEQIAYKPENRECGLTTKQTPKIFGTRPAKPDQWPWMAAIIRPGNTIAHCGGTLITDRHVLTAAHCVHQVTVKGIYIRLGAYDFRKSNETRAQDFRALWIKMHINYNPWTFRNDIAVVKLDRPALFNTNIWPVCMPPLGENWEGRTSIVTGWGSMSYTGPQSSVLKEVVMPIWALKKCKHDHYHFRVDDWVLCAGPEKGGSDSCQGDSGGPLIVQLPNKRWVVVGIVSWGLRCGRKNRPGVYTRVDRYLSWIMETTKL